MSVGPISRLEHKLARIDCNSVGMFPQRMINTYIEGCDVLLALEEVAAPVVSLDWCGKQTIGTINSIAESLYIAKYRIS